MINDIEHKRKALAESLRAYAADNSDKRERTKSWILWWLEDEEALRIADFLAPIEHVNCVRCHAVGWIREDGVCQYCGWPQDNKQEG